MPSALTLQDVRYPFRVEVPLSSALLLSPDGTLTAQPIPGTLAALQSDYLVFEFYPGDVWWALKVLSNNFSQLLPPLPIVESPNLWATHRGRIIERLGRDYQLSVVREALASIELARQVTVTFVTA